MGFHTHVNRLGDVPIEEFPMEGEVGSLSGPGWRIGIDWEHYEKDVKFAEVLSRLISADGADQVTALVIGPWDGALESGESGQVIEALVAARDQLPNLQRLFLGDILQEETEASWIQQSDISPLFLAFPQLVQMRVRGTNGLSLGRPAHDRLQHLAIEGGGLPGSVAREINAAELPELTHLELWLGDENYGRDLNEEDLSSVLSGEAFPKLIYLGLRNDAEADSMVAWLEGAEVLNQIEVLDLSLGCLSDEGAKRLLEVPQLKRLKKLDLHHHFIEDEMAERLRAALPGVEVDLSEKEEADVYDDEVYRYNFVAE